jgi:hypothetical protein
MLSLYFDRQGKRGKMIEQKNLNAFGLVAAEIIAAEKEFPRWPADVVHAAAIVAEESGELTQAALDFYYWRSESIEFMKREAVQTAATAIRFLYALEDAAAGTLDLERWSKKIK